MHTVNSLDIKTKIPIEQVKWFDIPPFQATSTQDKSLKFICAFGGPQKSIFEFGTWVGRSALGFTQNFKHVTSIDYIEASDIHYAYTFDNKNYRPGELAAHMENFSLIQANSLTYNFEPFKNSFDVVYVDGNHSEEGCTTDLKNAMLIGKSKSFIFVDDYQHFTMGVRSAVDKFEHPNKFYIADLDLILLVNE